MPEFLHVERRYAVLRARNPLNLASLVVYPGNTVCKSGVPRWPARDFAKHVAEVGRQRQVASFIKLIALQSRPITVYFAAAHAVA